MDFKELTAIMMKKLSKADKYIEWAETCEDKEVAKIYHKIAHNSYDVFNMLHQLAPNKAKIYLGEEFNPNDKMFGIMHNLLVEWGNKIKNKIDSLKI